jgi:hypothetical protein
MLLALVRTAQAAPVLHLVSPDSSFTQITTLSGCSTFIRRTDAPECNPALFAGSKEAWVRFGLATIADGDSVDTSQKLLFDSVKEPFLEELFNERAFTTAGMNSSIDFRTPYFQLSYDPVSVTADVFVFNPAFPEVAMSLVKSKRLGATSGMTLWQESDQSLSVGGTVFYYQRREFLGEFALVDLATSEVEDLIVFENESGPAGDLGVAFQGGAGWVPDVSLVVKNLGAKFDFDEADLKSERKLRPVLVYETHSRLGVGKSWATEYGGFGTEVSLPFDGVYAAYYPEYASIAAAYQLGGFDWNLGVARFQQVTGFRFSSKNTAVGIFFARTQPLGRFRDEEERSAGVQLGVTL